MPRNKHFILHNLPTLFRIRVKYSFPCSEKYNTKYDFIGRDVV